MGTTQEPLGEGEVVDKRFQVVRSLGKGGGGAVYEAEHVRTFKRVALKVMSGEVIEQQDLKERFLREAKAACALRHPAIVPVHDIVLEPRRLVLVMDLLDGEDMRDLIDRKTKLAAREAVDLLLPIASAVGALHAAGFVHRDVKPNNIFVAGGRSYLIDLGVVRDMREGATRLTRAGDVLGTLLYVAPETLFGEPNDHRVDIWSLGLVLYEALSGEVPTLAPTEALISMKIRQAQFPRLEELRPDVPKELAKLVHSMLAPSPADRPAGMDNVYDALSPFATASVVAMVPRPRGQSVSAEETIARPSPEAVASLPEHLRKAVYEPKTGPAPVVSRTADTRVEAKKNPTEETRETRESRPSQTMMLAVFGVIMASLLALAGYLALRLMEGSPSAPAPATAAPPPASTPTIAEATATAVPSPVPSPTITAAPTQTGAAASSPSASTSASAKTTPRTAVKPTAPKPTVTETTPPPTATPTTPPKPTSTSTIKLPFP